ALAPAAQRASARFHRRMLGGPLLRADVHDPRPDHRVRRWAARHIAPGAQLAVLLATSVLAAPLFVVTVVSLLLGYGLGMIFLVPWVLGDLRFLADWRRFLAAKFSGVAVPSPYAPLPPLIARPDGLYQVGKSLYENERWARWHQRLRWLTTDPATWREVAWRGLDPFVGGLLAAVPVGLVVYGVWGLILPRITQTLFAAPSGPWYGHVAGNAWAAIPVGLLLVTAGVAIGRPALGVHGKWTRWLLGPTAQTELVHRVEALTLSRADASAAAASELRRIERDLHDGTQARLVALGMSLGAVERLLDTDPPAARALLAKTRESAELALRELRQVVRGIHPPVLAERGLGDAVRALALDSPLPVSVTVQLDGRLPDPIEAAAYFAVAEALGNAAKHAKARTVDVLLIADDELLRIVVRDDGRGGADPGKGSGLRGLARRLGIFDGTVTVSSPAGGPTELTMEIPCASSSPRTSSSSAKA
ncbi:MAG: sensor histidine kinase, partial [Hamadaea sp.]|nr:sensor histidine kinase [Hamadaea sp.]